MDPVNSPSARISVDADFRRDLRSILGSKLSAEGYVFEPDASAETLLRYDLLLRQRRVQRRPRRVIRSSELHAREANLRATTVTGEPANTSHGTAWDALNRVETAVMRGDDMNVYASRDLGNSNLKALEKGDWMLSDTGLHHWHLGEGLNRKGQVNGTKELLFVLVTDEIVYFVEVFDHPSRSDERVCWADERAFQIAQSNWPQLFDHAEVVGGSHGSLTHEQRTALYRKKGNALLTAANGRSYFQPGGGTTPSGIPMIVTIEVDHFFIRLAAWEQWCRVNAGWFATTIEAHGSARPSSLRLQFTEIEASGAAILVEDEKSSVRFRVPAEVLLSETSPGR